MTNRTWMACLAAAAGMAAACGTASGQTGTFAPFPHGFTFEGDIWQVLPGDVSFDGSTAAILTVDYGEVVRTYRWTESDGSVSVGEYCGNYPYVSTGGMTDDGRTMYGILWDCAVGLEAGYWTPQTGLQGIGYLPGGFNGLGDPSQVFGASSDGSVLTGVSVGATDPNNPCDTGYLHGFRWTAETGMVDLGEVPDSQYSRGVGISGDGQTILVDALGIFYDDEGNLIETPNMALLWTEKGGFVRIPTDTLPEGYTNIYPQAISTDGSTAIGIVGSPNWTHGKPNGPQAFRWRADTGAIALGALPDKELPLSRAYSMTADGSIIAGVVSSKNDGDSRPFIWDEANGMRLVEDILAESGADIGDWDLESANISGDGNTLVGGYHDPGLDIGLVTDTWVSTLDWGGDCYADFTGDGTLDLFDFLGYVNSFNGGEEGADCTGDEVLDLFDFLCFVNAFNEGC